MKAFFKNSYLKGFSAIKFIQLSYIIAFKNYLVKTTSSATSLS
ncbi:hypothetical protein LACWKB8_0928 [Lactobacillus sp. wkB8]|nr:hypothetical protein LACWKB8_0928 [Lactobacillus sp. wkB8]